VKSVRLYKITGNYIKQSLPVNYKLLTKKQAKNILKQAGYGVTLWSMDGDKIAKYHGLKGVKR
jgi:hypothetical protein